jgi:hypothetical protein
VHVSPDRLATLAEVLGTSAEQITEDASVLALEALEREGVAAATENHRRRADLERVLTDRRERTIVVLERLHDAQQDLVEGVLKPYYELAAAHDLPMLHQPLPPPDTQPSSADVARYAATLELLRGRIHASLVGANLRAAGAEVGSTAAVLAWVATSAEPAGALGAQGRTTARAATLAWLGSGPLAAGELGPIGGTLVLGSIALLPALIATGGVIAHHTDHHTPHDAEESDRLDQAERELARTHEGLEATWQTINRVRTVTDAYTTVGLREIRWLRADADSDAASHLTGSDRERSRFDSLTDVVVTAIVVLGLPVLRDLQPDAQDDPDREERARWVNFILDHAAAEIDTHDGRTHI